MEDPGSWRLENSAGLKYRILKAGEGEVGYEDARITEEYLIRASDLYDWCVFGFPEPVVFGGSLRYPQQPVIPGLGTLVPNRLRFVSFDDSLPCDPFGHDPEAPEGTYCPYMKMVVSYGPTPENDEEQDPHNPFTFLTVSSSATGVFLKSPLSGKAMWELPDDAEPYECNENDVGDMICTGESDEVTEKSIPNTKIETSVEWSVSWPRIPFDFWDGTLMGRLRGKLGKVNDSSMPLFHDAPVDTILFMSFTASTEFTWRRGRSGKNPIRLEMKFVEKNFTSPAGVEVTHQHIWRPDYGYRKLLVDGNYMYSQTNLTEIWEP